MDMDTKALVSELSKLIGVEEEQFSEMSTEQIIDTLVEKLGTADHSVCESQIEQLKAENEALKTELESLKHEAKVKELSARIETVREKFSKLFEEGVVDEQKIRERYSDLFAEKLDFDEKDIGELEKAVERAEDAVSVLEAVVVTDRKVPETGRTTKPAAVKMSEPGEEDANVLDAIIKNVAERLNKQTA